MESDNCFFKRIKGYAGIFEKCSIKYQLVSVKNGYKIKLSVYKNKKQRTYVSGAIFNDHRDAKKLMRLLFDICIVDNTMNDIIEDSRKEE